MKEYPSPTLRYPLLCLFNFGRCLRLDFSVLLVDTRPVMFEQVSTGVSVMCNQKNLDS